MERRQAEYLKVGNTIAVYRQYYSVFPPLSQLPLRDPAFLEIREIYRIRDQIFIRVLPGWLKPVDQNFTFEVGQNQLDSYVLKPREKASKSEKGVWLD